MQNEIDKYLHEYFIDDDLNRKIASRNYTQKEIDAVKKDYLNTYLLPYMQPLFISLEREARENKLREICEEYKKIIPILNTPNKYRVHLDAAPEQYAQCRAGIEVLKTDENRHLFVEGDFNEKGVCYLSFTKYSVLVNHIESARAVLYYTGPESESVFYRDLDLSKDRSTVDFSLPKEPAEETEKAAAEEEAKKPSDSPEKSVQTMQTETAVVPGDDMPALFISNNLPLDVTIKKIRENSAEYVDRIVHSHMPKKNTLTINKTTGKMMLIYKLSGPFAPKLICSGRTAAPNTYKGLILTNDANKVEVGTFSLILKEK